MEKTQIGQKLEVLFAKARYEEWFSAQMKSLEFFKASGESLERLWAIEKEIKVEMNNSESDDTGFLLWQLENKLLESLVFIQCGDIKGATEANNEATAIVEKIKSLNQ